jgi:hypothetical protein
MNGFVGADTCQTSNKLLIFFLSVIGVKGDRG